jgi:hypothetical protein
MRRREEGDDRIDVGFSFFARFLLFPLRPSIHIPKEMIVLF